MRLIEDYSTIYQLADDLSIGYEQDPPFPHCVIEDLFNQEVLEIVLADFPRPEEQKNWRTIHAQRFGQDMQFNKLGLAEELEWPDSIRRLIHELNSGPFLHFLERLTGIEKLLPDPRTRGGGIHQVVNGGLLGVHADFTEHRIYGFDRRVNLLLYLNHDWQDEWEGHLELWTTDVSRCEKRLRPNFGRCVIFNTDAKSFHGHPVPLNCPEEVTRKSIALYYYTIGREGTQVEHTFQTDWQQLPETEKPEPQ